MEIELFTFTDKTKIVLEKVLNFIKNYKLNHNKFNQVVKSNFKIYFLSN